MDDRACDIAARVPLRHALDFEAEPAGGGRTIENLAHSRHLLQLLVHSRLAGLIAGFLASMVMRGGGYGVIGDIIVGILGALIGGFLSSRLLGVDVTGFNLPSILIAFVGACILIAILRAVSARSAV